MAVDIRVILMFELCSTADLAVAPKQKPTSVAGLNFPLCYEWFALAKEFGVGKHQATALTQQAFHAAAGVLVDNVYGTTGLKLEPYQQGVKTASKYNPETKVWDPVKPEDKVWAWQLMRGGMPEFITIEGQDVDGYAADVNVYPRVLVQDA